MTLASNYRRLIRHVEDVHDVVIYYENDYASLDTAHREDHRLRLSNHETLIPYLANGVKLSRDAYAAKIKQTDVEHGNRKRNGPRALQSATGIFRKRHR